MLTFNLLKHGLISTSRTSKEMEWDVLKQIDHRMTAFSYLSERAETNSGSATDTRGVIAFSLACLLSSHTHVQRTCALALFTLNSHVPSKYVCPCNLTSCSTEIHLDRIDMISYHKQIVDGTNRLPRRVEPRQRHLRRKPHRIYRRCQQSSKVRVEMITTTRVSSFLFQWEQENRKPRKTRLPTPKTTSSLPYELCMNIYWSRRESSFRLVRMRIMQISVSPSETSNR